MRRAFGISLLIAGFACRADPSPTVLAPVVPEVSAPRPAAPRLPEDTTEPLTTMLEPRVLPPLPSEAVHDEVSWSAHLHAQRHLLGEHAEPLPKLQPALERLPVLELEPEPMPGFFASLTVPPDAEPLAALHHGLAGLASGQREHPVRIAVFGASGTTADVWTGYVRAYLQKRFGDGGPGIIAGARHTPWYRHQELTLRHAKGRWKKVYAYRPDGDDDSGHWGVMGVAMDARRSSAWSSLSPSRRATSRASLRVFEVFHLQQPKGGGYRLTIDGAEQASVATATDGLPRLGSHRLELEPDEHELRIDIEGDGPVRLLGVVAETGKPGVVLDTLGYDGAKVSNQLAWDEALWAEHLRRRDPALVVLAYGANAAMDDDVSLTAVESAFRTVLERIDRAVPGAGCLLFGPGDMPIRRRGELVPRPTLAAIRDLERGLAYDYGCAHWDALSFVGGEGAKRAWVQAGLGKRDYVHLTRRGYVRLGMGFADALLQRYDWARLHSCPSPSSCSTPSSPG